MAKKFVAVIGVFILVFIVLAALGSGCSVQSGGVAPLRDSSPSQGNFASSPGSSGNMGTDQTTVSAQDKNALLSKAQGTDRLVIKNATLQIVVDNPQETLAAVSKMAEDVGGWVVTSSAYQAKTRSGVTVTQASLTIRVPAERLTEALQRIKSGAASVETENISGQDVTQDYVDLQSQLTNLEAAEAQLRKIMDSAGKTDDVLAVYKELVQVRGNIEVTKGRMQYYQQAAAYSSIQLTLIPSEQEKPLEIAGWRPLETAKGAFEALINTLQAAVNILIWLAVLIVPLVIVFGIPAWLIIRAIRRRTLRQVASAGTAAQ